MCKVKDCVRESTYKEQDVCQKHYFRFMRYGTYELTRSRKYRLSNPAGYQKLHEPTHELVNSDGYVYEHRFVYYNKINKNPESCELCGDRINWSNLHIDHKDEDVTNNGENNLRALCRSCNTFRGHSSDSMGKMFITINGKKLTPTAWSRVSGVNISGSTIRRRKASGMSDYDSVFKEKVTHKSKVRKNEKLKYDDARGIA